jgi:hypothetical protein
MHRTETAQTFVVTRRAAVVVMLVVWGAACRQSSTPAPVAAPLAGSYAPGLGEIMTLQQMRHTKLWFAGEAGNWDLAAYEVKELQEGFDDVIKFHPTHEESPVAPKDAIPRMVIVPLMDLAAAVAAKDRARFEQNFDELTGKCNDCHDATNVAFNRVQRPTANPYSNQVFAPVAAPPSR